MYIRTYISYTSRIVYYTFNMPRAAFTHTMDFSVPSFCFTILGLELNANIHTHTHTNTPTLLHSICVCVLVRCSFRTSCMRDKVPITLIPALSSCRSAAAVLFVFFSSVLYVPHTHIHTYTRSRIPTSRPRTLSLVYSQRCRSSSLPLFLCAVRCLI